MEYLYYSLGFVFLYVYLGLGLALLLTPPRLAKYVYLLSPLVGILVTRDQAGLAKLESESSIESLNVLGSDWWRTMWSAHFLLRKQLYFETQTYFEATPLDGEWNLRFVRESDAHLIRINAAGDAITINPSYVIEKHPSPLEARLGTGWRLPEPGHTWMGSESGTATIILKSGCEQLPIRFNASYWPSIRLITIVRALSFPSETKTSSLPCLP
jgi:hypothetical protein